mgnify:CR=1 FL=1
MSRYLDTSLLITALAEEPQTARIQTWLGAQGAGTLLISDWVVTEFASALSIKVRRGELGLDGRARVAGLFTQLRSESLTERAVSHQNFHDAASYASRPDLGLRAGDALHIAIAAQAGATICTLDRRLAEAAQLLAVPAELI